MQVKNKLEQLNELIGSSTREELIWMSGYLEGIVRGLTAETAPAPIPAAAAAGTPKVTLLYGTETGNAKIIATEAAGRLKKAGIGVKLLAMEQYRNLADLNKEDRLLVVMSTHGDGEPPVAARKFYDFVRAGTPNLQQLRHSVLALGDTSYPLFCKAGEDVDAGLEKLGSRRLTELHKADVDYAETAECWINSLLQALRETTAPPAPANGSIKPVAKPGGKKFYTGLVTTNLNLNDRGSLKQTHHIELTTAEPVDYRPGDSIGIVAENSEEKVQAILNLLDIRDLPLTWRNHPYQAYEVLKKKANIVHLPHRQVHQYSQIVAQEIPAVNRIDLLDLLRIYPVQHAAQAKAVVEMLEPMAPRLYSISSSPAAHDGVHLTVSKHSFQVEQDKRYGLCSGWLNGLPEGAAITFYVHRNTEFHLPPADKDLIMIGPGTGIAPFRSFLFERDAAAASGRNWLFFGDQHFVTDFLYQAELQQLQATGVLTRINTAFSRDQQQKVYVQHKLQQQAATVFEWLQNGAYLYICGAKDPMSTDVENTLLEIIRQQNDSTPEEAAEYLLQLKEDGRYRKDVY